MVGQLNFSFTLEVKISLSAAKLLVFKNIFFFK